MQKLWSSRSKRSQPLPPEEQDLSSPSPKEMAEEKSQEAVATSVKDSHNPLLSSSTQQWSKLLPKFLSLVSLPNKNLSQQDKSKNPPQNPPQNTSPNETQDISQDPSTKASQSNFDWQVSAAWVLFLLGIGGVVVVAIFGLQYLTAPESTPDSNLVCKNKLTGDWQTSLGKITLEEKSGDQVSAKYEYAHFERGKISGEFTGKLTNNVLVFDWKENPKLPTQQQGKGILIFAEGCKEFYGSYGTGDSTNNFGNWQGSRMSK